MTTDTEAISYNVCDTCCAAIVNADLSSYDVDAERVEQFLDDTGMVCHAGDTDYAGYWECEVCQQVCIGTGQLMEQL